MTNPDNTAFMLCFYVPVTHAEKVKDAVFDAGAGRIGNYDKCAWEAAGVGQFRPLSGSDAFIGQVGRVESVDELKVELTCRADCLEAVLEALRQSHPYETPVYYCWPTRLE